MDKNTNIKAYIHSFGSSSAIVSFMYAAKPDCLLFSAVLPVPNIDKILR